MSAEDVTDLLEEVRSLPGVRAALLAMVDGAYGEGRDSGLEPMVASDVAKTVRRIVHASVSAAIPLEELTISFGAARLLLATVREDATLVIVLDRHTGMDSVRALLRVEIEGLRAALTHVALKTEAGAVRASDADVDAALSGELAPVLSRLQSLYLEHSVRAGVFQGQSSAAFREAVRFWLSAGSPAASRSAMDLRTDGPVARIVDQLLKTFPTKASAEAFKLAGRAISELGD